VVPALVRGVVAHRRTAGVEYAFRQRAYLWLIDLAEVPRLPWYLRPLASFRSGDHLGRSDLSLRQNVLNHLADQGIAFGVGGRIVMLAGARVLGHVFNPLTVYWCFAADGGLECVVVEVHNTYGERHAYLVRPDEGGNAMVEKEFYVSPFFEVAGLYRLRLELGADRVAVSVSLFQEDRLRFTGSFVGRPAPASRSGLLRAALRHPLMPQRVSTMIRFHGIRLWLRRLPVVPRPTHLRQKGV
jgi:hypothetical protein